MAKPVNGTTKGKRYCHRLQIVRCVVTTGPEFARSLEVVWPFIKYKKLCEVMPKRKSGESPPAKEGKKETEVCVTCGKPAKSDCIECSWCGQWEHSQCNNLSTDELEVLGKLPPNVMFFCNVCQPKVTLALKFFNDMEENQKVLDKRLHQLEEKLTKATNELNSRIDQHIKKLDDNTVSRAKPTSVHQPPVVSRTTATDRSCNLVIYGIKESPSGTPKPDRQKQDFDNLMSTFSSFDTSIQSSSIKDLYRLGRYKQNQSRPRPILVKFLRVFDAEAILSKRRNVPTPIIIKPDMTKEERVTESLLLRERWNLIQNGIDRKFIKIKNFQIFVHNQLHGSVKGSQFQPCQRDTAKNSATNTISSSADHSQMEQDTPAQ